MPGDEVCAKRSEEHTSELQSHLNLVCRLLLEKKKKEAAIHLHQRTGGDRAPTGAAPQRAAQDRPGSHGLTSVHRGHTNPEQSPLATTAARGVPVGLIVLLWCRDDIQGLVAVSDARLRREQHALLTEEKELTERFAECESIGHEKSSLLFFFKDPAPPEISPLPLHAALPI